MTLSNALAKSSTTISVCTQSVLDVSYYVNNNESDYISVLAKINGDKVLGALKRVSQGYSFSSVHNVEFGNLTKKKKKKEEDLAS